MNENMLLGVLLVASSAVVASVLLFVAICSLASQRARYGLVWFAVAWSLLGLGTAFSQFGVNDYLSALATERGAEPTAGWMLTLFFCWGLATVPLAFAVSWIIYLHPVMYSHGDVLNPRYERRRNKVNPLGRHDLSR